MKVFFSASAAMRGRWRSSAAMGVGLFLLLNGTRGAQAELLTFDSLSGSYTAIPNGYGGLNWSNWWLENVPDYCGSGYCPSGYQQALVTSPNVAFEAASPTSGGPATATFGSSTPFTLNSFYATAAWRDDLQVTVTGYNGATQIDQTTLTIGTQSASFEVFNWTGLTSVSLTPTVPSGTPHGYWASDYEVAIDNVTINGVPEPGSWVLMLAGLAGLGFAGCRRNRPV